MKVQIKIKIKLKNKKIVPIINNEKLFLFCITSALKSVNESSTLLIALYSILPLVQGIGFLLLS